MIDQLLADASRIAEDYRYDRVEAEHLLFVLLNGESGREQIRALGLDHDEILSNLLAGFRYHKRRSSIEPRRLIVSDQVMQTLENSTSGRTVRVAPVLDLLKVSHPEESTVAAPRRASKARASRSSTDILLREPLPDLDELLDGLEQEEMFSGFDRICEEVFDGPKAKSKRSETTGLMDGARRSEEDRTRVSPEEVSESRERSQPPKSSLSEKERTEALRAVERSLRDLTEQHRQGGLDPVVGRDREIDQICEVLMRRRKSNVLLVGDPGVGKTALMEGVAARIARAADPTLSSRPVLQASLGALVAGARYRGDFEIRMELLIELAAERKAVLFFDEMQMLIGAGATAERGMDGANLLKPALARDGLSLVGATTHDEMELIRADAALMRRFELIRVREPRVDLMRDILKGAATPYLSHHRLTADERMLDRVIDFAEAYLPDRRFPDKAFDVLDTACVRARLAGRRSVQVGDVREAVRRLGGTLPHLEPLADSDQQESIRNLVSRLELRVSGHRQAVQDLASVVVGRRKDDLLTVHLDGPEGVGRRTLALALASELDLSPVELTTTSGIDAARVALTTALERESPRLIILNIDTPFDHSVSETVDMILSEDSIFTSIGKRISLKRSIAIIKKNVSKDTYGFATVKNRDQKGNSDIQTIPMPSFSGQRLKEAIRFEIARLSKIWSDSGRSRPIPSENDIFQRLSGESCLWSDLSKVCIDAMDES
ncbi:ATPase family protein associated with various cellular activities (AAA) [Gemmobacter caeni]|uniref:ATPase family protein associated with various cellular activities (AAA) n=1 Tax=Gemmobacter caeni TaxID=589035 RepID=A0A2T6B9D3_9RHOB|nr:AAA family ATPase [Gemmobacter caeni]PTX52638.1 ATPase family protein associated with various cellular activities (AAA) [Gemmobacter caeni]TWI94907.1 ATPase family protein associated with various cellular activities (AAA) [Gemmobacter caeni]